MRFIYWYVLPLLGVIFIKVVSLTYKVKILGSEAENKPFFKRNGLIYISFHQRFLPTVTIFAKKKPIAAIISQSMDGEVMSRISSMLGWFPIRGSSSKGGAKALKKAIFLIRSGYNIGHAVDGPQGPFGKVKPGVIKMAQLTRTGIVPVIMSFNKYWMFSSWDRFMLPKPFSKILLQYAETYEVPLYMSDEEFEKRRILLEKKLSKSYDTLDLFWKYGKIP